MPENIAYFLVKFLDFTFLYQVLFNQCSQAVVGNFMGRLENPDKFGDPFSP